MLLPHIWLCFPDPPSHPISVVLFPEHVSTFLTQCFSRLSSRPGMSFPWCLVSSWLSSSPPSGTGQIFSSHGGLSWISLSPRTTSILSASAPFSVFLLPTSVSRGTTYFPTWLTVCLQQSGHATWAGTLICLLLSAARWKGRRKAWSYHPVPWQ